MESRTFPQATGIFELLQNMAKAPVKRRSGNMIKTREGVQPNNRVLKKWGWSSIFKFMSRAVFFWSPIFGGWTMQLSVKTYREMLQTFRFRPEKRHVAMRNGHDLSILSCSNLVKLSWNTRFNKTFLYGTWHMSSEEEVCLFRFIFQLYHFPELWIIITFPKLVAGRGIATPSLEEVAFFLG